MRFRFFEPLTSRLYSMKNFKDFKELMSSPRRCVIVMHTKPDADALGSSLGLAGYLKKNGHKVTVISPSEYPDFLKWMNGNCEVIIYPENEALVKGIIAETGLIFCLDFSSLDRIDGLGDIIRDSPSKKVLIDHHLDPEDFADFELWSTAAASTAELIYELITLMGDESLVDKNIAESLYAGIMTDTGMFRHSSTTAKVHETVARLIRHGADVNYVARKIYDANTVNRLKLIGFALYERLKVLPEYNVAYFVLSATDLKKYNYQTGDSEGLVNYGLSIKGIKMAATIIERKDVIRMSFRSVGDFSVNDFARNHFSGGGHKNAAGGKSTDSLEETIKNFEGHLEKYCKQLNES